MFRKVFFFLRGNTRGKIYFNIRKAKCIKHASLNNKVKGGGRELKDGQKGPVHSRREERGENELYLGLFGFFGIEFIVINYSWEHI